MLNTMSKLRGQVKTTGYPQTEGLLGDCMLKYGKELGEDSAFGGYPSPSWNSGDTSWVGFRLYTKPGSLRFDSFTYYQGSIFIAGVLGNIGK